MAACEGHEANPHAKAWKIRRKRKDANKPRTAERKAILEDKAFQLYVATHTKPEKPFSTGAMTHSLAACHEFLKFLKVEVTDHSLSDLIDEKTNNPDSRRIEKALTIFKNLPAQTTHTRHASRVVGMFKANFAPLAVHIWVKSGRPTKPIAESILRAVRTDSELSQQHYDAIDLVAYAGERVQALAMTPPQEITFVEGTQTAFVHITSDRSKTAIDHLSAIPKELAERLLQRAQENNYPTILPNYASIWKTITQLTKRKYGLKLTSRYFRNRFESVGETTPADKMNPNNWMILAGSKPTYGHKPEIYGLRTEEQLAKEWEEFLMPRLALTGETTKAQTSKLEQLQKENQELKEQLLKLTKLLTTTLENQLAKKTT